MSKKEFLFDEFSDLHLKDENGNQTSIEEFYELKSKTEMEEISLKPFSKIWNEVKSKIMFVSKPLKSVKYFDYIKDEMDEIYGDKGNTIFGIILKIIEEEHYRMSGNPLSFGDIIHTISSNQWRKLIGICNKPFSSEVKFQLGKIK